MYDDLVTYRLYLNAERRHDNALCFDIISASPVADETSRNLLVKDAEYYVQRITGNITAFSMGLITILGPYKFWCGI